MQPNRFWVALIFIPCFMLWGIVVRAAFPDYTASYIPSVSDHLPLILAACLLTRIQNSIALALGAGWLLWYFVGSLNTVASALFLGRHYSQMPLADAARVYGTATFVFIAGLWVKQKLCDPQPFQRLGTGSLSNENPLIYRFLILFPAAWLISLYLSVGYIPALQGVDISSEIYEISYGPLYSYTAVIALSGLAYLDALLSRRAKWYEWCYLSFIVLLSFADGKRAVAMIFAGGLIPLLASRFGSKAWARIGTSGLLFLGLYILVQIVRQGGSTDRYEADAITRFMAVGVEYRDFVFSTNYLAPTNVPHYAWLQSALAAMINEGVLGAVGIDKMDVVRRGSAYIWADLFDSPYGIRTGIVSELWFAYGRLGFCVVLIFGVLCALLIDRSQSAVRPMSRLIYFAVVGLMFLTIMGQTTATTGTITVYLYVAALAWLERSTLGQLQTGKTNEFHGSSK